MFKKVDSKANRKKRHLRIRKKVVGTPEKPRLAVFRSLKHVAVQIIDDLQGHTLVAASSMDPEVKAQIGYTGNVEASKAVGKLIAEKALAKGIKQVVFDRGGYIYHGRIKALADAAREGGLEF